jgi:uncharacterized membrane protein YeaQ/YmgE (transglycosylase-associated protein family)
MHIVWTILIGFIVGVFAKLVHPGREGMGFIATVLLGIGGSLIATFLGQALGFYQPGQSAGFIGATIGAILLLVIYGFVTGRARSAGT